jgi:uncharacterized damage-inducible protein DinB
MNELAKALISTSAFAAPASILESIAEDAVHSRPSPLVPHSIYAEVWHMDFWQKISFDWIEGKLTPVPEHASEGFPADTSEPWDSLRSRFLNGIQYGAAISNDLDLLGKVVACPIIGDENRKMTVHDQLVSLAAHNAYHLGRIVLLRQLLGIWPPPSGGYSW